MFCVRFGRSKDWEIDLLRALVLGDFANAGCVLRLCWSLASEERACGCGEMFSVAVVQSACDEFSCWAWIAARIAKGLRLRPTSCSRRIELVWLHKKFSSGFGCGDNHMCRLPCLQCSSDVVRCGQWGTVFDLLYPSSKQVLGGWLKQETGWHFSWGAGAGARRGF